MGKCGDLEREGQRRMCDPTSGHVWLRKAIGCLSFPGVFGLCKRSSQL